MAAFNATELTTSNLDTVTDCGIYSGQNPSQSSAPPSESSGRYTLLVDYSDLDDDGFGRLPQQIFISGKTNQIYTRNRTRTKPDAPYWTDWTAVTDALFTQYRKNNKNYYSFDIGYSSIAIDQDGYAYVEFEGQLYRLFSEYDQRVKVTDSLKDLKTQFGTYNVTAKTYNNDYPYVSGSTSKGTGTLFNNKSADGVTQIYIDGSNDNFEPAMYIRKIITGGSTDTVGDWKLVSSTSAGIHEIKSLSVKGHIFNESVPSPTSPVELTPDSNWSLNLTAHGFNILNPDPSFWEMGILNASGAAAASTQGIRTNKYFTLNPCQSYAFKRRRTSDSSDTDIHIAFYTINRSYISQLTYTEGSSFTPPEHTAYVKVFFTAKNGFEINTNYVNDSLPVLSKSPLKEGVEKEAYTPPLEIDLGLYLSRLYRIHLPDGTADELTETEQGYAVAGRVDGTDLSFTSPVYDSTNSNTAYSCFSVSDSYVTKWAQYDTGNLRCNYFIGGKTATEKSNNIYIRSDGKVYITMQNSILGITTADTEAAKVTKFKTWTNGKTISVYFPLKAPTYTRLSQKAVNDIKRILDYKPCDSIYYIGNEGLQVSVITLDDWYQAQGGTGGEPEDGSVTTAKLAQGAVTSAKLADYSVTTAKLAQGAVNNVRIANNAVDTRTIKNDSVTADKIANGIISSTKLDNDLQDAIKKIFPSYGYYDKDLNNILQAGVYGVAHDSHENTDFNYPSGTTAGNGVLIVVHDYFDVIQFFVDVLDNNTIYIRNILDDNGNMVFGGWRQLGQIPNASVTDVKIGNRTINNPETDTGTVSGTLTALFNKVSDTIRAVKSHMASMKGLGRTWNAVIEHALPRRANKSQNVDFDNLAYHMNKTSITNDDNENAWMHGATSKPVPYKIAARNGFGTVEVKAPTNIEGFSIDGTTGKVTATTASDLGNPKSLSNQYPNYLPNATKADDGVGMNVLNISNLLRHRHYEKLDHPNGCVTSEKLAQGAVDTRAIKNGAVTELSLNPSLLKKVNTNYANYLTEPTVVGTWLNGEDIYERSFAIKVKPGSDFITFDRIFPNSEFGTRTSSQSSINSNVTIIDVQAYGTGVDYSTCWIDILNLSFNTYGIQYSSENLSADHYLIWGKVKYIASDVGITTPEVFVDIRNYQ